VDDRASSPRRPLAVVGALAPSAATEVEMDLRTLGYDVAVLDLERPGETPERAIAVLVAEKAMPECARAAERLRRSTPSVVPVLCVVPAADLVELDRYGDAFDDFIDVPYARAALDARLRRLRRMSQHEGSETIRAGDLELNTATYRVSIGGRPIEVTYMEYELLRFLVSTPGRIHTREAILRSVWGYDYYGGIRTVDVHVRRLRAKLGQEHGRSIETVRGVGYGFAT
jgi:DNA-binding response OmpR family regulator